MQFIYPPIIGIDELSTLIKRSAQVIKRDRSDPARQKTLPPAYKIHDTKQPLWLTEEVVAWLKTQNREGDEHKKRMGAPTKAERVAARAKLVEGGVNHG